MYKLFDATSSTVHAAKEVSVLVKSTPMSFRLYQKDPYTFFDHHTQYVRMLCKLMEYITKGS